MLLLATSWLGGQMMELATSDWEGGGRRKPSAAPPPMLLAATRGLGGQLMEPADGKGGTPPLAVLRPVRRR